jgi:hypothetical protein
MNNIYGLITLLSIALILHYDYRFPTGLGLFLLSLPLFIFAWFHKRTFFIFLIDI